jgi:hypothetical protein
VSLSGFKETEQTNIVLGSNNEIEVEVVLKIDPSATFVVT